MAENKTVTLNGQEIPMQKPLLPLKWKQQMRDAALEIRAMPPGPEKDEMVRDYQGAFAEVEKIYRVPPGSVSQFVTNAAAPFDYLAGLGRTAVGELALLLSGKENAGAGDRIASAVLPFGELATPSSAYMEKLGTSEMGRLSNLRNKVPEAVQNWLPEYDSPYDITGRGAVGFGLDMLSGIGVNKLAGRTAQEMAAASRPKGTGPNPTAAELASELRGMNEAAKRPPTIPERAAAAGQYTKDLLTNPGARVGKTLWDWRMAEPNAATDEVLKRPFGDVLLEGNPRGVTTKGLQGDVKRILRERTDEINAIEQPQAKKLAEQLSLYDDPMNAPGLEMPTTLRSEVFGPVFQSPQINKNLDTIGRTRPTQMAKDQLEQRIRDTAMHDSGPNSLRRKWEEHNALARSGQQPTAPDADPLAHGPDINSAGEALPAGELLHGDKVAMTDKVWKNPSVFMGRGEGRWQTEMKDLPRLRRELVKEAQPARRELRVREDGTPYFEEIPATEAEYRDVPYFEPWEEKTWIEGDPIMSQPSLGATQTPRKPAPYEVVPDILDFADPSYQPHELRRMAQSLQGLADDMGIYGQPSTFFHPSVRNQNAASANKIEGWMANEAAKRARGFEMQNLDKFSPGAGGNVWQKYSDQSSLREGAPFLTRDFTVDGKRSASTGMKQALRGTSWTGMAANALGDSADTLKTGLARYLMSPAQRYLTGPATRAYMLNSAYQRDYNDPKRNPWGIAVKTGRGK